MAIKSLKALTEAANKLKKLRINKEASYQAYKMMSDPLDAEIEKLSEEILAGFRTLKINNIKLESGESYTRALKQGVEIMDELKALEWAIEHRAVSIHKVLLKQQLRDLKELPPFFKRVELEEVRVTKPKEK